MLSALIFGLVASPGFSFYPFTAYDSAVPRPESVLGYGPGERHTRYDLQQKVVEAFVRTAPGRTRYIQFGESVEGRPLRLLAISSEANISRLEEIRRANSSLAQGEAPKPGMPAIVWINQAIHGNETASFESSMWLAYNLVAAQDFRALDSVVVLLNPSYNPDGHERYVTWYNSIAVGSAEPGAYEQVEPGVVNGRSNHYRFDLNRDRVAMSQPETRQEVAEFLRWNPQVYVDQHGQVSSYFFPPNAMSINSNVDRDRMEKWTVVFGKATGKAFDDKGFTYYIRDVFDLYYPGYLDSWTSLSGAIGMTHETGGPKSRAMRRSDGSVETLRDGIEMHFVSALAVIQAAADNREELLKSYAEFKKSTVSGSHAGEFKAVVVKGTQESLDRLMHQLGRSGIYSYFNSEDATLEGAVSIWTRAAETVNISPEGALVVPMAQAQGRLAKALLEVAPDFEPGFVEEQLKRRKEAMKDEQYPGAEGPEFYDLTAWNPVLAHNLEGWWVKSLPVKTRTDSRGFQPVEISEEKIGWAFSPSEETSLLALRLLQKGWRLQSTSKEMKVGGLVFPAGTVLALVNRNQAAPEERSDAFEARLQVLKESLEHYGGTVVGLSTSYPDAGRQGPGSESVSSLKKPKIGVVFGSSSWRADFGYVWFALEREWGLPFVPLHTNALNGDLSDYSCLIFPSGQHAVTDRLKEWVDGGGCLVMLGGSWGLGSKGFVDLKKVTLDKGKEPGDLPGAFFKGELDPRSFLSYGYPRAGDGKLPIAVPVLGSSFYKAKPEGGGAVVFSADPKAKKLLSGWVWPDETEKALQGVVWLHDEPVGSGHVVWFSQDPTARAMFPGLHKLLLNAILYGPSG
jgi:hypothetical protein